LLLFFFQSVALKDGRKPILILSKFTWAFYFSFLFSKRSFEIKRRTDSGSQVLKSSVVMF